MGIEQSQVVESDASHDVGRDTGASGATSAVIPVLIETTMATKVSFAMHQSSVPVLRDLSIENRTDFPLQDLVLELTADPAVLAPKRWRIDRIPAGASVALPDRDVALNAEYLLGLTEAVAGRASFVLTRSSDTAGAEPLASLELGIDVLAPNEWGGAGSMPELLTVFVQPNDPAVERVLRSASDILRGAGRPHSLDGYESRSKQRTYEMVSAIWSAVSALRLSYAICPASFETEGQKIRFPSAVLGSGLGNCLDLSLLFASAVEQAGLNPILLVKKGHAFFGAWLQPQEMASLITEDASAIRKLADLGEIVVVESTLVTSAQPVRFSIAVAEGNRHLDEEREAEFEMAIDVRRARMQRLRPLALNVGKQDPTSPGLDPTGEAAPRLDPAPDLGAFDPAARDDLPATPEGRLARWQRKLLDLSVRNRLLNVKPGSTAIPLLCPDPGRLEDLLADGKTFRIVAAPRFEGAAGRDADLHRERTGETLQRNYSAEGLERGEISAAIEAVKLDAQLVELYRKSRTDMAEGGANTLFLAIGFLRWRKSAADSKNYMAPLILVPVKLERTSVRAGVRLSLHEDEPRINSTLLQMLRQDFELAIPELDGPLPVDGSGIDVARVFDWVRRAVRDTAGFELATDVMLGAFSFAKYLMWKDLVDRTDALKANAVVRHLLETPREPYPRDSDPPAPGDLDKEVSPCDLFTPLPADSSQLAAVVGSARGCDFVLDGPPGTGKSQTIANIIAHNLALGRRVLFVAEKRAALDVVHRRLKSHGLGPFCLELHSNKAVKQDVLHQLDTAWTAADTLSAEDWDRETAALKRERDALNGVVDALHRRHPNGLTVHRAVGLVVRDGHKDAVRLSWPRGTVHDGSAMADIRDAVRKLELNRPKGAVPEGFALVDRAEWSNSWQAEVVSSAAALARAARDCQQSLARFSRTIGTALSGSGACLQALAELADLLVGAEGLDMSFAFETDARGTIEAAREALPMIAAIAAEKLALSDSYVSEAALALPVDELEAKWVRASASIWPLSVFRRGAVAKAMAPRKGKKANPGTDLLRLKRIRTLAMQVDALAAQARRVSGWRGVSTDVTGLERTISAANGLRSAVQRASDEPIEGARLRTSLGEILAEGTDSLAPSAPLALAARDFSKAQSELRSSIRTFESLASPPAPLDGPDLLVRLESGGEAIRANATGLNAWTAWRRARARAAELGLSPLVDAIEAGAVSPDGCEGAFEVSYCRWWAETAIDDDPILRSFNLVEHDDRIERFRKLDEKVARLTERYIRSKLCAAIPSKAEKRLPTGYAVLQKQLQLQRRHKPIRQLVSEMGPALTTLAPCLLMSPLAVAQYLPANAPLFDLVIFDEASQIAPWDAVGAIARGRQVIVAGDPKQMPPTSFFGRSTSDGEDDEAIEEDMESILDECIGAALPQRQLTWHYRSLHESLIAFSNSKYYGGQLITFPAPVTRESAVSLVRVDGIWGRSKSRTNQPEAEAIVAEVVKRLTDPAFVDANGKPRSLAVITLNSEQQRLIEDLLDKARHSRPELEPWFAEGAAEPVVVKNLETVQGDERDLVLLGIGYGPETPGATRMPMNFGPLNRKGGWRRLNVAVTRARGEMMVFSSFEPHMIDLNRTSADAVRDLKHFLEFAKRGPRALGQAVQGSMGGYDSPFEQAVAEGLRDRGWSVVTQVGVSSYRIDLGIVHPDRPGDYLCGVECDGATYHSAATARDRDKVREAVLKQLGWSLARVWSTDWWIDRRAALDRLHLRLEALLRERRCGDTAAALAAAIDPEPSSVLERLERAPTGGGDSQDNTGSYRFTDLSEYAQRMSPEHFFEAGYDEVLGDLIGQVVRQEAPLRDLALVERIARAHGFKRSGHLIRERVLTTARKNFVILPERDGGAFVWPGPEAREAWNAARFPATDDDVRGVEDISLEELRAAISAAATDDRVAEAARRFGVRRLTAQARTRMEEAATGYPASHTSGVQA